MTISPEAGNAATQLAATDKQSTPTARSAEAGSLVTEYGLLVVVAATVAGVIVQWATGGAIVSLFNALLDQARSLVGA
ncbi:MAG: hypothetical protein WD576_04205 [Nitriliruptoraceae bacterium]